LRNYEIYISGEANTVKCDILLVPFPKKVEFSDGDFRLSCRHAILIRPDEKETIFVIAKRLKETIRMETNLELPVCIGGENETWDAIFFERCRTISGEGYSIRIDGRQIKIEYGGAPGAFHAVSTLKQIIKQCGKKIPCLAIEDEPDYKVRGIMIDISRNKIPTMETLFNLVDFMADVKMNHLQLYIEGFSFAYPSFPEVWKDGTPVTGEQIMELDRYCRERFIDLVPNQNSFGHMTAWLAGDEFKELAESTDGTINSMGLYEPAGTLNPLDPESLRLVERLYDDLLPNFTSGYFNVGCDEPFELGRGKSRKACEEHGTGRVYLDYLLKVYKLVKERKKRMMFWGDIIGNHPELIKELPEDVIVLEWGYESDHPFDENCRKYKDSGISFFVCPGTSSWKSLSGRTDNMKGNLVNAAVSGKKHGAEGFINTDWGDCGHWQYQPISYASFVYGAGLSWNVQDSKDMDIGAYLDEFVFMDKRRVAAQNIMDMGNYYLLEQCKVFNRTSIAHILYTGIDDMRPLEGLDEAVFTDIEAYIKEIDRHLDFAEMHCKDAGLIDEELRNTCRLILHGAKLAKLKILLKAKGKNEISNRFLAEMIQDISRIMNHHRKCWLARNRPGGLEESLEGMQRLKEQYERLGSCKFK